MPDKIRYWNKRIKSYLDSGLNQRQFCETNNLNFNRFKYFYRKLHLNKKVAPAQPIVDLAETVVPLIPVELQPEETLNKTATVAACKLTFPNGLQAELYDITIIKSLLQRWSGLC